MQMNASECNRDVTRVCGFLISCHKSYRLVCMKIRMAGDFLSSHQTCKTQHFRFAMWNPWWCDRSERLPNLEFCWLIMSQFKVEKGLIAGSWGLFPFMSDFINFGSTLRTNGLLWLKRKWIFSISLFCMIFLFSSHQSKRIVRSIWESKNRWKDRNHDQAKSRSCDKQRTPRPSAREAYVAEGRKTDSKSQLLSLLAFH